MKSLLVDPLQKAADFLISRAYPAYNDNCGKCAKFVREAVEYGFAPKLLNRTESAKNYGPSYEKIGFKRILSFPAEDKSRYQPKLGDIAIINYEPHGHICFYSVGKDPKTGKNFIGWISDFRQRDLYGGKIREKNPSFCIYRYSPPTEQKGLIYIASQ